MDDTRITAKMMNRTATRTQASKYRDSTSATSPSGSLVSTPRGPFSTFMTHSFVCSWACQLKDGNARYLLSVRTAPSDVVFDAGQNRFYCVLGTVHLRLMQLCGHGGRGVVREWGFKEVEGNRKKGFEIVQVFWGREPSETRNETTQHRSRLRQNCKLQTTGRANNV